MEVYVSDSALADDLVGYLRRAKCIAERTEPNRLAVSIPHALAEQSARLEVDTYLQAWQAVHPGVTALRKPRWEL
jgi:hypothetical protein